MRKIGFFGGTFNPIHFGHLRVALECKQSLKLDEMRMMICAQPPHRESPGVSALQRKQMLELALTNSEELILDGRELERDRPSYSVETLESLRAEFPDAALFMVIGSDSFQSLDAWHRWGEILDFCHLVIARRPDNMSDEQSRMGQMLRDRFEFDLEKADLARNGKIFPIAVSQLDISATAIREMIASERSAKYLLPDNVLDFIQKHNLYSS